jgi:hypothetical protein
MEDATSKEKDVLSCTAFFFECKPYQCFKQRMLRICNPNKLKTWLRFPHVPPYIISHFPINSWYRYQDDRQHEIVCTPLATAHLQVRFEVYQLFFENFTSTLQHPV